MQPKRMNAMQCIRLDATTGCMKKKKNEYNICAGKRLERLTTGHEPTMLPITLTRKKKKDGF
jgi:hypothetical protein